MQHHPFTHLLDENFYLSWSEGGLPDVDEVNKAEAWLNWQFPEAYRQFLLQYGSACLEVDEAVWPRDRKGGRARMFKWGWLVFGLGPGTPDWLNLEQVAADFWGEHSDQTDLLPVFQWVSDADYICFNRQGDLVEWSHETGQVVKLADSFDTLLINQTQRLCDYRDQMKANVAKSAGKPPKTGK